jgi:hypothetical protein
MQPLETCSNITLLATSKHLDTPSLLSFSSLSSLFYHKLSTNSLVWINQLTLFAVNSKEEIEEEREKLPKDRNCIF